MTFNYLVGVTLIGLDVLSLVGPLPDDLFYLDLFQFHGKLRNNKQYLAPLLRLSIDPWQQ